MSSVKSKKQYRQDNLKEDILQAVILADSFHGRFEPITHHTAVALLPLVNTPLIEYTLECLITAGVQEIYVVCCSHADKVRKFIEEPRWKKTNSMYSIKVIVLEECYSIGDLLREVDAKAIIRSDFILVHGESISTLNFKSLMEKNRKRREADKSSVLTIVCKKVLPRHRARTPSNDLIMAVEEKSKKILFYKKSPIDKTVAIPTEIFEENKFIDIHYDLMDPHIYLCSPLVPQLFSDNFDYSTMDDLVRGLLINEEIMGNSIHVEIVHEEYACHVSSPAMYDAVSRDVVNRWTYPYVPDVTDRSSETYCCRNNIYTNPTVSLARDCVLKKNVVLGSETSVGANSIISDSVIGRNCVIGADVVINRSYIWNNVTIEDKCSLDSCIVCESAIIRSNVTVLEGCILSFNTDIGPSVTLEKGTLLRDFPYVGRGDLAPLLSSYDQDSNTTAATSKYGEKAFVYEAEKDSDEESEICQELIGMRLRSPDGSSDEGTVDSDSGSETSPISSPLLDDSKVFYAEMIDTLTRAREEKIAADNQILEINSLKHAYNITIKDLNSMVIQAMIELPSSDHVTSDVGQIFPNIKKNFQFYHALIQNYIKNKESQRVCLNFIEDYCLQNENKPLYTLLPKFLHFLYDSDVIQEEVILSWYSDVPSPDDSGFHRNLRNHVAPLIKWLKEAEEESDDDD